MVIVTQLLLFVSQPKVEEVKQRLEALSTLLSAERRLLKERQKDIDKLEKEVRGVYHRVLTPCFSRLRRGIGLSVV